MHKSINKYFQDSEKAHAYLQAIVKTPLKFEKDRHKTVGEVAGTRYILPIHFCCIMALKSLS